MYFTEINKNYKYVNKLSIYLQIPSGTFTLVIDHVCNFQTTCISRGRLWWIFVSARTYIDNSEWHLKIRQNFFTPPYELEYFSKINIHAFFKLIFEVFANSSSNLQNEDNVCKFSDYVHVCWWLWLIFIKMQLYRQFRVKSKN